MGTTDGQLGLRGTCSRRLLYRDNCSGSMASTSGSYFGHSSRERQADGTDVVSGSVQRVTPRRKVGDRTISLLTHPTMQQ